MLRTLVVVRNCYIHDIWGQMGGDTEYTGYFSCAILVHFVRSGNETEGGRKSTINDVLIENNRIERFDKCGIISWGARDNVVVRRNYIENTGGDGIFVNGTYRGLIEFNEVHESCMRSGHPDLPGSKGWWPHTAAVWIQDAEETIMQFNEVYDTGREKFNGDGFAVTAQLSLIISSFLAPFVAGMISFTIIRSLICIIKNKKSGVK